MKKKLCLFLVAALTLASCSSDENGSDTILPTIVSYKYSDSPGDNDLSTIKYNGNKIVTAGYTSNDKEVYTYTGDVITKIEDFAQEGNISSINEFTYESGKLKADVLTEIASDRTYISKRVYTYNTNGTISFVNYSVDPTTKEETKKSDGVLTYVNGNLISKIETFDSYSYTKTYQYDAKNNPFKNILGFNLLIDHETNASLNNVTKLTTLYKYGEDITTNIFNSVYQYNEKGYPTKQTQTDSSQSDEITEYTY
jgi:major membrane immunogen (membrane-anchored lipoprotein)